jgi:signal transduction histidine kinase
VRNAARSLWAEPRVPDPPTRVWRDWALVAVLVPLAVLEVILREDLVWRPVALVLGAAPVFTLLWRRTHPLVVVAVAFGAQTLADVATLFGADESAVLYTTAYVLLLPYSLFRWGSGRDAAIGLAMILVGLFINDTGLDLVIALGFFLFSAALGAAIRYQASSRLREMDQVKFREREQLARELHDTVAHHVSAIAIRAQAGAPLPQPTPTPPWTPSKSSKRRLRARSPRCAPWSAPSAKAKSPTSPRNGAWPTSSGSLTAPETGRVSM